MDSIRIETGSVRIAINDDPDRIIEFDPTDLLFVERFYKLINEFETKLKEYQKKAAQIDVEETDENGIPVKTQQHIDFIKEACNYIRGRIDYLFGKGTSQTAFGDSMNLYVFSQFFEGVTPFIQKTREIKTKPYITNNAPPKAPARRRKTKKK